MSEHEFDYQIPIEDTDTYQMVYHANYLRVLFGFCLNFRFSKELVAIFLVLIK